MRPVNVLLPHEDVRQLKKVKERFKIPYGEFIIRAIFYLRKDIWERYRKWERREGPYRAIPYRSKKYRSAKDDDSEMGYRSLRYRRKKGEFPDYERWDSGGHHREYVSLEPDNEFLSNYRGYAIREQLDKKVQDALEKNPGFDPEVLFDKLGVGKKSRLCFQMKNGDIELLDILSKGEVSLGACLHYVINRTMNIDRNNDRIRPKELIKGFKPHSKKTFTVREFDCREMDEFIDRYNAKYAEELTRSEIVVLAYHLFKRRGEHRQEVALDREEQEGKDRGKVKKISVSFSYEGTNYLKKNKPSPTDLRAEGTNYLKKNKPLPTYLRAALYSFLKSRKFRAFMDADSVESVGVEPFEEDI